MNGITKLGWTALALAALIVVADQAVKYWILEVLRLQEGQTIPVFGPLRLTGVWNAGVSFGFLQARQDLVRWGLSGFSILVAVMLAVWVRRTERPLFAVAIGLVMGGAVGNVIDRIRFGAVVDFVDVSRLHFPWVFNLADSAITIGICLLLLDMLRQDSRERSERAGKNMGQDAA
ncbi:signal peptidase II [Phenylobacterium sp.]|jgi:signal peptidase II|uniref:signal peptidase II n=1 Tax=Phenylobacterium sp. TaxID=1871053 RepID=UPI002E30B113|nr:signal peptidase II [Phenylobacterium sp.]HEX4709077.1 signal peptidase II [Phenylobacterium sp.]